MPSFSRTAASGTGSAPALNTMYGLTVPGPSRTVRETLSFRDDFSKIVGTHAFKAGYEILYFRANYFQLGQPSGIFQFDNMTAGLQPNGQPRTEYRQPPGRIRTGSGARRPTSPPTRLRGCRATPSTACTSRTIGRLSKTLDPESGYPLVHRKSLPHRARVAEQFQPDHGGSGDRQDGRHRASDGRVEQAQPEGFSTAPRPGVASAGSVGVPRRLRHQHRRYPLPQRAAAV